MRPEGDTTEEILARCLEAWDQGGSSAVRAIVARHPERRVTLERRLGLLGRIGMGPASEPQRPAAIGDGRFRVERELGRGGMGVVWLVHDERLGRRVALKTGPTLAAGERARERFEREVRAASRLDHPRLVPILDVGRDGETPWFTMEYVAGTTLAEALERVRGLGLRPDELDRSHLHEPGAREDARGRTWIESACRVLIDVAEGLEHVHSHGIVHRDVKPSNILVGADGRARLFDLGLAHIGDEPGLTRTGDLAGTPHYVAPEQVGGGGAIDARTDVHALGVTLYELLTLRRPFEARTTADVLARIQSADPVPPRRHHRQLPRELETICLTALEKDPGRRYPSAAAMAADLERFLGFRPIHARPPGWPRRALRFARRRPAHAALLALGLLVAVGTPLGLVQANAAIRRQRDRAERTALEANAEAERTRAVLAFWSDLFVLAAAEDGQAGPLSARELLDLGATRAAAHYVDRPLLQASLFEAIGRTYENLGRPERAIPLLDRSLALRERELGQVHLAVARVLHALARAHLSAANLEAARALAERALRSLPAEREARVAPEADLRVTLGEIALAGRDSGAAREHFEAALAARRAASDESLELAEVLTLLGDHLLELGELDAAEEALEEGHAIRRGVGARVDLPALAASLESLARLHERRARPAEARAALEEALGLYRKAYGGADPAVAAVLERLARLAPSAAETAARAGAAPPPETAAAARLDPRLGFRDAYDERYQAASQAGVTALQAAQYERAVEAFEGCLALVPRSPTAGYNLACALARAGRVDEALDALERATLFGQDDTRERVELLAKDPDLEPLRGSARFARLSARWRSSAQALRDYQARAAHHVPESLHGQDEWPVVIVLHAQGGTKDEVVRGEWRALADELDFALLAPSGRVSLAESPEQGASWIRTLEGFEQRAWEYEEPIERALESFRREHPIARGPLVIVGEGEGALLALDVALQSPGLFRGVLLRQGTVHASLGLERLGRLATLGTRVLLRLDETAPVAGLSSGATAHELARAFEGLLAAHGIAGDARVTPDAEGQVDLRVDVERLLKE